MRIAHAVRWISAVLISLSLFSSALLVYGADDDSSSSSSSQSGGVTFTPAQSGSNNALVLRDAGAQSPKAAPGATVRIVLPLAVNRDYLSAEEFELRNITIEPVIPSDRGKIDQWPFDLVNASYLKHLNDMSFNDTVTVTYDFRISQFAGKGVYPVNFRVTTTVWQKDLTDNTTIKEDVSFEFGVYVTITDDGGDSGVTSGIGPLIVSGTTDGRGVVRTPKGQPGQTVTMYIPLINKGGTLTNITVSPVVTRSVEEFPFVAEQLNYGRNLADMKNGTEITLDYTFTISPYATSGNKPITFRATYRENGVYGECTFTSYVYIENGYEELIGTAPVVTIIRYELLAEGETAELPLEAEVVEVPGEDEAGQVPDEDHVVETLDDGENTERPLAGKIVERLMAGDAATLRIHLRNNADADGVRKVTAAIALGNQEALAFTSGSSDTAYIDFLEPGATGWFDFNITARASAPVGPSAVGINVKYETKDFVAGSTTQNIMIPVKQPMRIVIDEPIIYGQQKADAPISVNVNIVNMGRAKLFNLNIVALDGLAMYESYYGGDLLSAGTLNADVQVIAKQTGSFTGKLLVGYEDNDGDIYSEEIELPIDIEPVPPPEPPPESEPQNTGPSAPVVGTSIGLTALGAGSGIYYFLKLFRRRGT